MLKRRGIHTIVLIAALIALLGGAVSAQNVYTIATVFKLYGDDWFLAMEEGVKQFERDTGHRTIMTGPPLVDAALQVQVIEDLIAQRVDAITVAPISVESLEPVLKKAMDAGIVVIVAEGSNQANSHYNLEAFDPAEYGAFMMDRLAALMGEEGEYVTFVGSLTTRLQMEVVDGAIARQEAVYPRMKQVRDRVTSDSSQAQAYRLTKELLVTYPNLVGVLNTAAPEAAGIGLAIEEMGLEDETFVVGTSLPSVAGQYLETGAVDIITFWDPRAQAYAMNKLALMVLEGEPIYDGMDLGIPYPGYDNLRLVGKVLYGRGWIEATAENMHEYPF